ncbi:MAG TPA: hypothetical protein VLF68_00870 [Candidatus Saccharimonadales bacterium]|nr:hypothetical protein [Candidatus Saccharimonadales bacterium]
MIIMSITFLALIGTMLGFIFNQFHSTKGGVIGAVALGVLGAIEGAYLANFLFGFEKTTIVHAQSFAFAIVGALSLLILRVLFIKSEKYISGVDTTQTPVV